MPLESQRDRTQHATDRGEQTADEAISLAGGQTIRSEDLHVRNYDVHASHTVAVTVYDDSETVAFAARYHLRPGQAESECDVLSSGTYVVEIRCDGVRRQRERCDISDQPAQTAMIELGNGAVSITENVY